MVQDRIVASGGLYLKCPRCASAFSNLRRSTAFYITFTSHCKFLKFQRLSVRRATCATLHYTNSVPSQPSHPCGEPSQSLPALSCAAESNFPNSQLLRSAPGLRHNTLPRSHRTRCPRPGAARPSRVSVRVSRLHCQRDLSVTPNYTCAASKTCTHAPSP